MQDFIKQNAIYLRKFLEQFPFKEPCGYHDCRIRPEPLTGEIKIKTDDLMLLCAFYPSLNIGSYMSKGRYIDALRFLDLVRWDNGEYWLVEDAAYKLDKAIMSMIPTNLSDAVAWLKRFKDMVDLGIMDVAEYDEKKEQVKHLF